MLDKSCLTIIILTILSLLLAGLILFSKATMASASWVPLKKNWNQEQQDKIAMVWRYSQDPAVVLTFERESGFENAISPVNKDGSRDYSECQLNSRYHWAFISSPAFKDWHERIAYCMAVYARSNGKAFNGYFVRESVRNRFVFFNN